VVGVTIGVSENRAMKLALAALIVAAQTAVAPGTVLKATAVSLDILTPSGACRLRIAIRQHQGHARAARILQSEVEAAHSAFQLGSLIRRQRQRHMAPDMAAISESLDTGRPSPLMVGNAGAETDIANNSQWEGKGRRGRIPDADIGKRRRRSYLHY
jgi:hypothetical protein